MLMYATITFAVLFGAFFFGYILGKRRIRKNEVEFLEAELETKKLKIWELEDLIREYRKRISLVESDNYLLVKALDWKMRGLKLSMQENSGKPLDPRYKERW